MNLINRIFCVKENFMKKILVTGGTTFVSKYVAEYFVNVGYEVFVLNRNSKPQVQGVKLIEGDRHNLGGVLKDTFFDVVADITAYNDNDIIDFVRELGSFDQYIMISSSAVYPEYVFSHSWKNQRNPKINFGVHMEPIK